VANGSPNPKAKNNPTTLIWKGIEEESLGCGGWI